MPFFNFIENMKKRSFSYPVKVRFRVASTRVEFVMFLMLSQETTRPVLRSHPLENSMFMHFCLSG